MGWYDARETDAWAVGVVVYALVCRELPFGEGVPGPGGDERIERGAGGRGRDGGGEGEQEKERKRWLMKIAKGEYEWPPLPPPAAAGPNPELGLEPRGTDLAGLSQIRGVVERLLVRDRKKRARLGEVVADAWRGEGVAEGEGEGRWGKFGDGSVAWREIE